MEADREKEVSSLQRESSKGVPPTSVLDSDDEEDALRSRARSLYVAPRNGVERGSRAGQGWGLTFSLSLPHLSPLSLSLSLSLARARALTHTHSLARSLYAVQHAYAQSALFVTRVMMPKASINAHAHVYVCARRLGQLIGNGIRQGQ